MESRPTAPAAGWPTGKPRRDRERTGLPLRYVTKTEGHAAQLGREGGEWRHVKSE